MPDHRALAPTRPPRERDQRGRVQRGEQDGVARRCVRPQCGAPAAASMSYDYAARVVFVGRLAAVRHPALYDLCEAHADQLRVPKGWTARVEPWVGARAATR